MAAPTLTAAAGSAYLRIRGGTSGDPVTFNDVWDWDDGGGSSGGDGDVPIDGGGTAKVNTFITEVVADAIYTVQAKLHFGDDVNASFFKSANEHVYFDDGIVFDVRDAATLQLGTLTGSWGVDGAHWSIGPSANTNIMDGQTTAVLSLYASRLHVRTEKTIELKAGAVTLNKAVISLSSRPFRYASGLASLDVADVYCYGGANVLDLAVTPDSLSDYHGHSAMYGIVGRADVTATGVLLSSISTNKAQVATANATLVCVDPQVTLDTPWIVESTGAIRQSYTVNVHVNDEDGADLESATVAATSFGNIVSNDAGSTFYRCVEDHTAGTFATDVAAGKWELTTAANAALAGVTGAAKLGAWVTGIDYVAASEEFSVSTDANGDIAEQTLTEREWYGTSEAMLSFAPYTFVFSKTNYETLTLEHVVPDAAIAWVQELQDAIPTRYDVEAEMVNVRAGGVAVAIGRTNLTTIVEA